MLDRYWLRLGGSDETVAQPCASALHHRDVANVVPKAGCVQAKSGIDRCRSCIDGSQVTIEEVMRKIRPPFYRVTFFVPMLVTYLPEISLWLPRHVLR